MLGVLISFFFAVCCCNKMAGQGVRSPVSATYVGIGAYSNNHVDAFSFTANQAALAKLKSASAGIYGEKRFLLNELSLYDVAIALPTHSGNFGADARYWGFTNYSEAQLGLAYARSLENKIDLGIQFNYYSIRIAGYGNASSINFEIGTLLHLTDKLNVGLHVYNPTQSKLGKSGEEKLASIYAAGIGFEPSQNFLFSVQVEKEEYKAANVIAGFQYKFLPQLMARLGVSATTSSIYIGIGLGWRFMRLDATASYHPELGITPGLMLIAPLSQKESNNDIK